jgi:hypothetical protein
MAARGRPERSADSEWAIWRQNSAVPLSRIAWIATVAICVVAAVLVLLNGYVGYFFVLLAVGAAASINLR